MYFCGWLWLGESRKANVFREGGSKWMSKCERERMMTMAVFSKRLNDDLCCAVEEWKCAWYRVSIIWHVKGCNKDIKSRTMSSLLCVNGICTHTYLKISHICENYVFYILSVSHFQFFIHAMVLSACYILTCATHSFALLSNAFFLSCLRVCDSFSGLSAQPVLRHFE